MTTSISLDEIMPSGSGSVDPSKYRDEIFDLYSVPAYDNGQPEITAGRNIGSAKQVVQPGDVLLSRIVPHIRRAWVVGNHRGRRMIASGEWIVFRSDRFHGGYLRHLLLTDQFHARFMQTVSGVGGSLLRARPAQVSDIEIHLPSLSEQQRIATMLEQADRLRRTRRYALELSDTFLPAAFSELFGSLSFQRVPFEDLALPERGSFVNGPFGSNLLTSELVKEGVPVIYIRDIADGRYERVSTVCVTPTKAEELSICSVVPGDLLIAKVGDPPGKAAVYPHGFPSGVITQDVIRLRPNTQLVLSEYLLGFLNSSIGYKFLKPIIVEGTRERFGLTSFKELAVPIPPLARQKKYASLLARHERLRARLNEALRQADHLFQSLLDLAFS